MWIDTKYRSQEEEIMDDLDMSGEILIDSLDKIAIINQWLGGNALTLKGIFELLKDWNKEDVVSIIDLGCGNGDMLRALSRAADKKGYTFKMIGVDANQATINYANELSRNFDNIEYVKQDVLSSEFNNNNFDIALCTLFLHHFENKTALKLIQSLERKATIGVIVNDLHRHPMAYYLFKLITLFVSNKMMKEDGQLSILKGFKRKDLESFAKKLKSKSRIKWKWAFRYQWLLFK